MVGEWIDGSSGWWEGRRTSGVPREAPLIWVAVVVLYPLVSVYPQELILRVFLFHRYAPLLSAGSLAVAASAAAFGFAHVIFGSVWSVLLTLLGGGLFAWRYRRTRSLLAASVEHALYGVLAFTIGLGDLFYHGATAG
ncbi:CPBP family glutamic-type intramembrane protease [Micromonospora thermarum]|uniref:CPBP family glutamic-type intramembrane protease n=1 Tax=Micromonospora thermarum TaxID=2720024 RepID=UPI00281640C6|nr:CPBP family glutamic-type intramembrane protease [Micromonospora thermarum]